MSVSVVHGRHMFMRHVIRVILSQFAAPYLWVTTRHQYRVVWPSLDLHHPRSSRSLSPEDEFRFLRSQTSSRSCVLSLPSTSLSSASLYFRSILRVLSRLLVSVCHLRGVVSLTRSPSSVSRFVRCHLSPVTCHCVCVCVSAGPGRVSVTCSVLWQ
ncbi:unnamed protein product [Danaus chrysippus]|uniref:(African queen) hypothetical protein n=1 Tax=Danaus chrysippus TaxID=151541 RepID=A0A8J2WAN9_9NEOP|nr:unnamed protein product [Danaus chrysippus]